MTDRSDIPAEPQNAFGSESPLDEIEALPLEQRAERFQELAEQLRIELEESDSQQQGGA